MKKEILERVLNTRKNIIIEGDVASGKTTDIMFKVVDNIISDEESLFIVDAKEEYIKNYHQKFLDNGYNTIILNLRNMPKNDFWNPLEYPYNLYKNGDVDKAQEYLEILGKTIFYDNQSNSDSPLTRAATSLFVGTSLSLFFEKNIDDINFRNVYNMFNLSDEHDYFLDYVNKRDVMSKESILASMAILAPKDTSEKILSLVREKLGLYVSRNDFSFFTSKTTFNIEEIKNKKTAIILVTKDENTTLGSIASMFIEQLYFLLLDLESNHKFNFILDNFDTVKNCNNLIDILGSCLARNIKCYMATRMVERLSNKYSDYIFRLCDLVSVEDNNINNESNIDKDINTTDEVSEVVFKDFEKVVIEDDENQTEVNSKNSNYLNLAKIEDEVKKDNTSSDEEPLNHNTDEQSNNQSELEQSASELENVVPDTIYDDNSINSTTVSDYKFDNTFRVSEINDDNQHNNLSNDGNMDALIKQIDEEINEISKEKDNCDINQKNEIISELSQFKID